MFFFTSDTIGLSAIFIVYTMWRLREVHDGFFIKKHLRNMVAWSVVMIIYSNVTVLDVGGHGQLLRVFQYWLTHAFVWETVTLPLYMSCKNESAHELRLRPKSPPRHEEERALPHVGEVPDFAEILHNEG